MIDVIVPVWNLLEKTKLFIGSIENQNDIRLIIVDNGSDENTKNFLASLCNKFNNIKIITNEENMGYVKAINQGLTISKAPFILLVNNDIILPNRLLDKMVESMNNFDIIAPLTNNSGGRPDTRLIEFSNSPTYKNINSFASKLAESKPRIEPIDFVYGHCMMIKR